MKRWAIAAACGAVLVGAAVVLVTAPKPEPLVTAAAKTSLELEPGNYAVGVDNHANFDPASFGGLAEVQCVLLERCSVGIWRERDMPTAYPLTEAQVRTQLFALTTDQETTRIAWNCRLYRDVPRSMCVDRLEPPPAPAS